MDAEYINISQEEFQNKKRNYSRSAKQRFAAKIKEEHPPIRKRVFNPELKELAGVVISHEKATTGTPPPEDTNSESPNAENDLEQPQTTKSMDSDAAKEIRVIKTPTEADEEIFEDIASDDIVNEIQKNIPLEETGIEGALEDHETRKYPPDIRTEMAELPIISDVDETNDDEFIEINENINSSDFTEVESQAVPEIKPIEEKNDLQTVIEKVPTKQNIVDLNDYFIFHESPYGSKLMTSMLENLKTVQSSDIDFSEIMGILQRESATSSFVILGQDQMFNVYRILTSKGLDKFTQKNLFFSNRDIYLNRSEPFEILKFQGRIREDFNFKKRFSSDFLTKFSGALFLNLHFLNFPGWIIFFYRSFESVDGEQIAAKLASQLPDFIPLFERYRREQFPKNPFSEMNMYDQVAFMLNRKSCKATEFVNIIYIQIIDSLHNASQKEFQKIWDDHLLLILTPKDKLIVQGPARWIIMSQTLSTDKLMSHVQSFADTRGARVVSRNIVYPDNGNNVLNYIFTGPRLDKK